MFGHRTPGESGNGVVGSRSGSCGGWCPGRARTPEKERPVGIEPTLPPWQGSRLPLHHGRLLNLRVRPEGLEPSPIRLKAEDAAANTSVSLLKVSITPYRIRTGVTDLKSQHPEPLDERGKCVFKRIISQLMC